MFGISEKHQKHVQKKECQILRGRSGGGRVDELMGPRAAVYQLRAYTHCLDHSPKLLQVFRQLRVIRTFTVLTLSAHSEFYTLAPLARWCPSPSSSDDKVSEQGQR
jgi:hypothetical protein